VRTGLNPTPFVIAPEPPDHAYTVEFPTPVNVREFPEHKEEELATGVILGEGKTDTEVIAVLDPQALVPVTV